MAGARNGRFMLDMLRMGANRVVQGQADAMCFAPLNKGALRAGGMTQEDELRWFADLLGWRGTCGELNVLESLWTSRVTSHIALRDVASHLTPQGVAQAIVMITDALRATGLAHPRIAVSGLNPHNGDNGTAYDIAGQGKANGGAMRNAFLLARRMGAARAADRASGVLAAN